ncbi:MAG: hypothetical protein P1U74_02355 [Legionellaceae bacterium]|nr:hypothetical protein [Legionellaceae bacterium]
MRLKLDDFMSLFWQEISEATGVKYDFSNIVKSSKELCSLEWLNKKHSLGGLEVKTDTLQVIDKYGMSNKRLFAIGELTKGACFLTTDLGTVTSHAARVVEFINSQFLLNHKNPATTLEHSE